MCVWFSRKDFGLCLYHLFIWSNCNFLFNSQLITFSTQLRIRVGLFWANLSHSLIISSLLPHNLHLLFYDLFIIIIVDANFTCQLKLVFHWSLSHRSSPQVFRTPLNILSHFSSAVVWMISLLSLISSSLRLQLWLVSLSPSSFPTFSWPSQLGLQNTLTASLQRGKTPPMSVQDMTLNNLMAWLQ